MEKESFNKDDNTNENITDNLMLKYIKLAQLGNENSYSIIINFFERDLRTLKSRSGLWVPGYDNDDLYQELRTMLSKAIKNFNPGKLKNRNKNLIDIFRHLVFKMCRARIITLIQSSSRHKNKTLNISESLDAVVQDQSGNEYSNYDKVSHRAEDIGESIARRQVEELLKEKIYSYLTELEKNVLDLMLEDYSYCEMAQRLSTDEKSIDNAIQRARKKIRSNLKTILAVGDIDSRSIYIKKYSKKKDIKK